MDGDFQVMDDRRVAVDLFKRADEKIEKVRDELCLIEQKQTDLGIKVDRLTERIDNGVSVTAQKTLEKVTEMVLQLSGFAATIGQHDLMIKRHDEQLNRIVRGIFWIAFTGIGGGLVAFIFSTFTKLGWGL